MDDKSKLVLYKRIKKALLVPPVLVLLFILGGILARVLGGCSGGLGSGISCTGGKFFENYAAWLEVSAIVLVPIAAFYTFFCVVLIWIAKKILT